MVGVDSEVLVGCRLQVDGSRWMDPEAPMGCRFPLDEGLGGMDPEAESPVGGLPLDVDLGGVDPEAPVGGLPLDADLGGVDPEAEASMGVGGVDPGSRSSCSVDSNVAAAASLRGEWGVSGRGVREGTCGFVGGMTFC